MANIRSKRKFVKAISTTADNNKHTRRKTFARFVESLLLKLTYFNQHRELIQHSVTEDDKELLTALYRGQNSNKTIVLLSHFDTVGVDDYATHHQYAFNPDKLQEVFHAS